jgi:hypothetical protein
MGPNGFLTKSRDVGGYESSDAIPRHIAGLGAGSGVSRFCGSMAAQHSLSKSQWRTGPPAAWRLAQRPCSSGRNGPVQRLHRVSEPLTTNGSLARQRAGHFFAGVETFPVLSYTIGTEGPQEPSFRRRGAGRAISRGLRGGKPEWSARHPGDSHAPITRSYFRAVKQS